MAEYIEREALIEKLRTMPIPKQAGSANTWLDNCAVGVNAAIWEVASFPTADVAPVVRGRWSGAGFGELPKHAPYGWACSACGGISFNNEYIYCPHCGAKMDGGAE